MIDTGDTAWVLISAALVFLMTPGLGFFYGGMVRSKNVLTTIMQSFFIVAMISVEWLILGYTMTFGADVGGFIGSLEKFGLANVGMNVLENGTIPELAFVAFQCMFAVITPALITGAFAERMKFRAFTLFILLWAIFIYNPMAHWVWGGGFLAQLGALDFAGGLVIHILSGVSGLTLCILLGKRRGYGRTAMLPHNLPMTVLGAASGCIAGLVAITPAAGFVAPMPAIFIGFVGGAVCYGAVAVLKEKMGYDDSLDAFGVHGLGGTWGSIATGLFATTSVNPAGADGLFYGDAHLLMAQVISTVVAYALAIVGSFLLYKIVNAITPMRADEAEETAGLDIVEHGEHGYTGETFSASPMLSSFLGESADAASFSSTMLENPGK